MILPFTKMHGLGNDFIMVDGVAQEFPHDEGARWAPSLCDRHFGIGADGLIFVLPSQTADFRMRLFNADGSEGEMCGNGLRCLARLVYERGHTREQAFTVETLAGIMRPRLQVEDGQVASITVDMGEPHLLRREIPMAGEPADRQVIREPVQVAGRTVEITGVSMGNPHIVLYVDDPYACDFERLGPALERHPLFPQRTNVEFVRVLGPDELQMRVWERGVGETMACGSGACAVTVASALNGLADRCATVHLRGGDLLIEWRPDHRVWMTGPAREVFEGSVAMSPEG